MQLHLVSARNSVLLFPKKTLSRWLGRIRLITITGFIAAVLVGHPAQAATETWTGATSTDWTVSSNWNVAIPTSGDTAAFDSLTYPNQPALAANTPQSVLGLQFGDGTTAAGALTLSATASATPNQKPATAAVVGATSITLVNATGTVVGEVVTGTNIPAGTFVTAVTGSVVTLSQPTTGTVTTTVQLTFVPSLTIGASGITVSAGVAGIQTISAPIILGASQTWNNSATLANALTASGVISLGANGLTITGTTGSSSTVSGVITGTGPIVINTSGGVSLTGANTFSGGVTLNAGTLTLSSSGVGLGTGTLTLNGGAITGGTGNVTLPGNNAMIWGGSFQTSGSNGHTFNLGTGAVTVTAPLTLTVANGTTVVGGAISGGNGIFDVTKAGGGGLVIAEHATYTGAETLNITAGTEQFTGGISGATLNVVGGSNGSTFSLSGTNGTASSTDIFMTGTSGTLTLNFDSSGGITTSARAKSVKLSRSELTVTGNSTNNSVDTITNALTIDGSLGYTDLVAVTANAAKNAELTAGSLVQTNGGVVVFSGTNLGANTIASATAGSSNISFATAPTLVGGGGSAGTTDISIIAGALGDTTVGGAGTTFVTYTAANGIRPLNLSTEFVTGVADGSISTNNAIIASSVAYTTGITVNSLIATGSAAENISGGTITVTSGNVLLNPTNSASNLITLSSNLAFGSNMGYIGSSFNRATTVSGIISGTGGLTLYQVGQTAPSNNVFTFGGSGQNTYTGDTYILGFVNLGSETALPSGTRTGDVYIEANGTLRLTIFGGGTALINGLNGSGFVTYTNSAVQGLSFGDNNANGTFSGTIINTSGGALSITKIGTGTETLSGTNNSMQGATSIQNGTIAVVTLNSVAGGTASSSLGHPVTIANGTIALGSGTTTGELSDIGTGETTDRVINLAGTSGGGTLDQSGTGNLEFTSNFTATGAGAKTLTLQGSTAGTGQIDGTIVDNNTTNKTSLVKSGTGLWSLNGANTYSGGTSVNAGTLLVNNTTGSGTGSGALNVGGGATLGGSGLISSTTNTINGNVLVGQTSAADHNTTSVLQMTAGTSTTFSGANLSFNLDTTAVGLAGNSNTLALGSTSSVIFNGTNTLTFNLQGGTTINSGTLYDLFTDTLTGTSPFSGTGYNVDGTGKISGLTLVFDVNGVMQSMYGGSFLQLNGSNIDLDVVVASVPEPGTWALMLGGLGLLLAFQRGRSKV